MAKKSSKIGLIYLIGMALVAVGFCLPMFKGLGTTPNGFKFLDFSNFGFVTIGGLSILVGAVLGIVFTFVGNKKDMLKLIALIVSVVGGVILIIGFNDSWLSKLVGKGFFKHAYIGFWAIIAGWVVALIGWITKK